MHDSRLEGSDDIQVNNLKIYDKVARWFYDRGLNNADPKAQTLKLMEEVGEFVTDLNKGRDPRLELGDIGVVWVGLCTQFGSHPDDILAAAYEKIKNRKGKLVDGVFIKEEDL